MSEVAIAEPKKGLFGKKKTVETTSPVRAKKPVVEGVDTPSTIAHEEDDNSVGSSVSGGKTKKKPRAEYQKQIDALTEEKKRLETENEAIKADFELIKNWALSPPLKEGKVLDFSKAVEEESVEQEAAAPTKARIFRKKPRAEYQAEIDALLQATETLKSENNHFISQIKAVKTWAKKCPV